MAEEQFLTVEEVATRLRCHPQTIRRWIHQGKLTGKLYGGTRLGFRIPESELAKFIDWQSDKAVNA